MMNKKQLKRLVILYPLIIAGIAGCQSYQKGTILAPIEDKPLVKEQRKQASSSVTVKSDFKTDSKSNFKSNTVQSTSSSNESSNSKKPNISLEFGNDDSVNAPLFPQKSFKQESPFKNDNVAKKEPQLNPDQISQDQVVLNNEQWLWPIQGRVINTFKSGPSKNTGIDLSGNVGDPVRAAKSGKVVYSGQGLKGYGKLIIIKHDNQFLSAYGYNRKLLVKEGDEVRVGQTIAEMGQAEHHPEPLLRFEIRQQGKPVDPLLHLPR